MKLRKKVKKWGNSGGVSIPRKFIGKYVTITTRGKV